jgi:hypothetical protein
MATKIQKAYACRFCGQCGQLDKMCDFKDEKEANEVVTLNCDCYSAIIYKKQIENIAKLEKAITDFNDYCEEHCIKTKKKELIKLIFDAGVSILDGVISECTLKIPQIKIGIKTGSKNYLSLSFNFTDGRKIEI